jgi:hypothetical protein
MTTPAAPVNLTTALASFSEIYSPRIVATMNDYDVGGFRINLRPPQRDSSRSVDLVYITAEGRVLR